MSGKGKSKRVPSKIVVRVELEVGRRVIHDQLVAVARTAGPMEPSKKEANRKRRRERKALAQDVFADVP